MKLPHTNDDELQDPVYAEPIYDEPFAIAKESQTVVVVSNIAYASTGTERNITTSPNDAYGIVGRGIHSLDIAHPNQAPPVEAVSVTTESST